MFESQSVTWPWQTVAQRGGCGGRRGASELDPTAATAPSLEPPTGPGKPRHSAVLGRGRERASPDLHPAPRAAGCRVAAAPPPPLDRPTPPRAA